MLHLSLILVGVCVRAFTCVCVWKRERVGGEREGEIWCFYYPAVKSEFIIIDYLVGETSLFHFVRLQSLELDSESGSHKGTLQVTWHTPQEQGCLCPTQHFSKKDTEGLSLRIQSRDTWHWKSTGGSKWLFQGSGHWSCVQLCAAVHWITLSDSRSHRQAAVKPHPTMKYSLPLPLGRALQSSVPTMPLSLPYLRYCKDRQIH